MTKRFVLPVSFLLLLPLLLLTSTRGEARPRQRGVSISTEDSEGITRCDQIRVRFDDAPAIRSEETVGVAGLRSLQVDAAHNGGVYVTGWDRSDFEVVACKATSSIGPAPDQVRATVKGDRLSATGPDDDEGWLLYFLVRAPRGATLGLHAHNGAIALQQVDGNVTANALNGPISVKDSSGRLDARTENGPISFEGGRGNVTLFAQNGPISVKLAGSDWSGKGLEARTENGPLDVAVSSSYRSGLVVESDGHSPFSCKGAGCRLAKKVYDKDDDDGDGDWNARPHRLELGGATRMVHLSTVNGPVSVKTE